MDSLSVIGPYVISHSLYVVAAVTLFPPVSSEKVGNPFPFPSMLELRIHSGSYPPAVSENVLQTTDGAELRMPGHILA